MGSIFSKATQSFGLVKPNVIWKLTNKAKYTNEINGGVIIFFRKFDNKIFLNLLAWLWTIWKESTQEKGHNQ